MAFDIEDRLTHTPKPAFTPASAQKAQPVMRELQSSGDIRILILDDDPATCSVIQAALSNRDFVIDVVSDPALVESALARPNQYHLIILDYVLPGLEPDNVFALIRDSQPDANIVVVTGYPSVDSAHCLRAHLRLSNETVPGRSAARSFSDALKAKGSADDGEALRNRSVTRFANAQGPWPDFVEHERPNERLAWLSEPNRTRQELRVDRDSVPHLFGTWYEDERAVPGSP